MRLLAAAALSAVFTSLSFTAPAHAQSSGIQRLIAVTQLQAENANNQALEGADKQRGLVREQQQLRSNQRALDNAAANNNLTAAQQQAAATVVCQTCVVQSTSDDDEDDD